jgi:hypothetical protein
MGGVLSFLRSILGERSGCLVDSKEKREQREQRERDCLSH